MKKAVIVIITLIIIAISIFGVFKIIDETKSKNVVAKEVETNYYKFSSNGSFGILSKTGETLIEAIYDDLILPNQEIDVFFTAIGQNENTKYKILNKNKEEIFQNIEEVKPIAITGIIGRSNYEQEVLKYKENNKYGLMSYDGKKITKAIYDEITSLQYKEGEFVAKKNGKVGIIDSSGKKKVDFKYDTIIGDGYSSEEYLYKDSGYIVSNNTADGILYGYINSKGKIYLKTQYDSIERILEIKDSNEIYLKTMKNGQYGLVQNDKSIISYNYQELKYDEISKLLIIRRNQNYGIMNIKGETILPLEYTSINIEGIYISALKNGETFKFDYSGNKIENEKYTLIEKVENTNYYICIDKEYQYGLLDENMKNTIKNKYEYLGYMFNEYFIAKKANGKYGLINNKDEVILEFEYDVIQNIKNTKLLQAMKIKQELLYIFDENAKQIFKEKNANILLEDTYLKVYCQDEIHYFDFKGNEKTNKEIYPNNKLVSFVEKGKFGFKNLEGKIVVPAKYDRITEFNKNGFAGIKTGKKWGSLDQEGNVVLEPTYVIEDIEGEPDFLGKYYRLYFGDTEFLYTDISMEV